MNVSRLSYWRLCSMAYHAYPIPTVYFLLTTNHCLPTTAYAKTWNPDAGTGDPRRN